MWHKIFNSSDYLYTKSGIGIPEDSGISIKAKLKTKSEGHVLIGKVKPILFELFQNTLEVG